MIKTTTNKGGTMRIGKLEKRLLMFGRKYTGWHSYNADQSTISVVKSLVKKDLIAVNQHRQFAILPDQMLRVVIATSTSKEIYQQ